LLGVISAGWVSYAFDHSSGSLVTDEMAAAAPTWDRRHPNPPLSAEEAMMLADVVRKRFPPGHYPVSQPFENSGGDFGLYFGLTGHY
jgi:hypothetical protein